MGAVDGAMVGDGVIDIARFTKPYPEQWDKLVNGVLYDIQQKRTNLAWCGQVQCLR